VGCLRTGCAFVVRAKPDKNGQWVVTDSGVEHSCDAEGATRKRQLSSSILKKLAPDVEAVAVVRGSAAATVQNIVAGATGVQLKRTQATAIAKGNLGPDRHSGERVSVCRRIHREAAGG
jgi:hypothetical protein